MSSTFSAALSALKAHSTAVSTVGHNLANLNTTGFKANVVSFRDVVAESMGAGMNEAGMGLSQPVISRSFAQGAIQSTSGALDAALQGNGFFALKGKSGETLLTRDGNFTVDSDGYLVTMTGERVQQLDNGAVRDIQIPFGSMAARPTSSLSIVANLNAGAKIGDKFSTPVEVVDSLGARHLLTMQFTKSGDNKWNYDVLIPGADVGKPEPLVSIFSTPPSSAIEFDSTGSLIKPAIDRTQQPPVIEDIELTVSGLSNKAADLTIKWSFFNSDQQPTLSQFAQASSISRSEQNGYPPAQVASVGIAPGGRLTARYANGQEQHVATLAIALVSNPQSLASASNNNFRLSVDSAAPVYAEAGSGGRGRVVAGALEGSTVDIAREFTNLIVYQRGYQANSRMITTADEITQETLNLKR